MSVSPSPSAEAGKKSPSVSPAKKSRKTGPGSSLGKALGGLPKRQGSEGPPPKTAVSKFFDRDKTRKAYSTPASPVDRSRS